MACLAYSATEYAMFNLSTMAASEITLPPAPVTVSSTARGAFTESVAVQLAVSADRWMPLFGGPEPVSPPRPEEGEDIF